MSLAPGMPNHLSKFLTSPSKIAHALDWRKRAGGNVVSMSIGRHRIDLSVASHPESSDEGMLQTLPSIPIQTHACAIRNKYVLSPAVADELSHLLQRWQVCGLIVSWPVQEEGWAGASCGRVLFTLDQLCSSANLFNANRKFCLWNDSHRVFCDDAWGRSPMFTHTSSKSIHYASQEQYNLMPSKVSHVWNDFCRAHWPDLLAKSQQRNSNKNCLAPERPGAATAMTASAAELLKKKASSGPAAAAIVNTAWLDDYEDTAKYTKAALWTETSLK